MENVEADPLHDLDDDDDEFDDLPGQRSSSSYDPPTSFRLDLNEQQHSAKPAMSTLSFSSRLSSLSNTSNELVSDSPIRTGAMPNVAPAQFAAEGSWPVVNGTVVQGMSPRGRRGDGKTEERLARARRAAAHGAAGVQCCTMSESGSRPSLPLHPSAPMPASPEAHPPAGARPAAGSAPRRRYGSSSP